VLTPSPRWERGEPGEVALPQEEPTLLQFFDDDDGGPPESPSRTQLVPRVLEGSLEGAQLASPADLPVAPDGRSGRPKGGEWEG